MFPDNPGAIERDIGIAKVVSNNSEWIEMVINAARRVLQRGEITTGEIILAKVARLGVPPPKHHNARGAVTRTMALRGMLRKHGTTHALRPQAHARLVQTWEVL